MKKKVIISNPEDLEKNLQYISPITWIILSIVALLIAGLFSWSFLYKIQDKIIGKANVIAGEVTLNIDNSNLSKIKVGQKVYILDQVGEIVSIKDRQPIVSSFSLVDGEYEYTLINEMRPIDFLVK